MPRLNISRISCLFLVLVSAAPIGRLIFILSSTGANNQSNDDVYLIHQFVAGVLQGGYQWRNIFQDTFHNTHSNLVPGLIYLLFAQLVHLDVYAVLYFGIALAIIKLVLLYDTFTRDYRAREPLAACFVLPLMSALVFSVAQMTVFEHDLQTVKSGLNELGVALMIWALVRFPRRTVAACIVAIAGVVASFSFANGVVICPIAFALMFALGFRRIVDYAIVLLGAVVSLAPYAYFLVATKTVTSDDKFRGLFRFDFIIEYIGAPFSNTLDVNGLLLARVIGITGLALLVFALLILHRRSGWSGLRSAAGALTLCLVSLANAWQISLFRKLFAPWYIPFALDFWIGLSAVAFLLWSTRGERTKKASSAGVVRFAATALSLIIVLFIAVFFVMTNRSHTDKSFFINTRAPVSAACLQHYETAPTYCDGLLVTWPPMDSGYTGELGSDLAKNRLSVFAPTRELTLQGDTALNNVRYVESGAGPPIAWSVGRNSDFVKPTDFRHLNLFVPTPGAVDWTVTLPPRLKSAQFHSAIGICKDAPVDSSADGVDFRVYVTAGETHYKAFNQHVDSRDGRWHPFTLDMAQYAGQTITLQLTSDMGANFASGRAMYRYPRIDMTLLDDLADASPSTSLPCNVDVSSEFRRPVEDDTPLDSNPSQSWNVTDMTATGDTIEPAAWQIEGPKAALVYKLHLDEDISRYSDLYFKGRLGNQSGGVLGAIRIYCMMSDDLRFLPSRMFTVPMLPDNKTHGYTFPIRLLGLEGHGRLVGLMIVPIYVAPPDRKPTFTFSDLYLLKNRGTG